MKKTYTKPEIMFEDFSVSASIAANCESIITTSTVNVCFPMFGRKSLFSADYGDSCSYKVTEGVADSNSGYDGFCYHVPNENYNLFTS